ncbi:zinc finger protein 235 [Trichonephila clavipes]|nr:zinc finger protein 235 [Trichonephila clavipes]
MYRNQFPVLSTCSQMPLFWLENQQEININQPSISTETGQTQTFPQINTNHFAMSFGGSLIQSNMHEMNPHFPTNQLNLSSENRQMEFAIRGMNAESSAHQGAVRGAHYNNLMVKRVSSAQHKRINEINFNLQKYSKKNPTYLDSVRSLTVTYKDSNPIHKTCLDQKEVNISSLTENEIEEKNKTFASDSSLKNKETSKKCKRSGPPLNNKNDHIRSFYDNKKTSRCGTFENKLVGKLNPNQYLHSHIDKAPKDGDGFENGFNQKSRLVQTCAINTAEKMHACEVSKKTLSNKYTLKRQRLIHATEKPFKCDMCKKKFSRKDNLKVHYFNHTGEKPFKCNKCKKSFRWKRDLNRHNLVHTGEKPFKCDKCTKSFGLKGI